MRRCQISDNKSNGKAKSSPDGRKHSKKGDADLEPSSHRSSRRSRSRSKLKESSKRKDKSSKEESKSKKDKRRSRERDERKEKEKDKERDRRSSKDRHDVEKVKERSKKDRSGSREKRKRSRSRSKDRKRDDKKRPEQHERKKSRSPGRRRRSNSPRFFRRGRTPPNGLGFDSPREDLSPEERDARTIFCMQLSQRVRARDLQEFFSSVGKVRDVRLITCNKTKRFKGIAYVEFRDPESVALALGLSGQKLLGIPISVQHTQAEKNRLANTTPPNIAPPSKLPTQGPMRLYVGSLHFNITEDMLRGIFEPFGKIDNIQLIMDAESGRSKGYGFITFHNADDAKKALDQLNGFELAGRPMKVGNVTERLDVGTHHGSLDNDEMDRSGIDLGATGRLQLMFKLAENAGLEIPQVAANALLASAPQPPQQQHEQEIVPQIATQCFLLVNMFDPATEVTLNWDQEIMDDVIDECNKHGGVLHVFVDTASSEGKVYVKCPSIATAVLAVNALHGRYFAGRVITAAYVPLLTYHQLFPDALASINLLQPLRNN